MTKKEQKLRQRLADIVDCEGSMGIYHYLQRSSSGKPNHCWVPTLTISQKQKERLVPFQEVFGGKLCFNAHSYRLTWDRRSAAKMVRYLLPDIEWKRKQAELFLDACSSWPLWDGRGRGFNTPFSITVERANLANSVNALNEGGKSRVIYRVMPSEAPDAVNEANDGERVTVIHEKLNP